MGSRNGQRSGSKGGAARSREELNQESQFASNAISAWVFVDDDDHADYDIRTATRELRASRPLTGASIESTAMSAGGFVSGSSSRIPSSSGRHTAASSHGSLGVEGSALSRGHKMRKKWMHVATVNSGIARIEVVGSRPSSALRASTQSPDLSTRTPEVSGSGPVVVTQLNLPKARLLATSVKVGEQKLSPHATLDVQPFLGPELKKALGKQGMRVQKLDLTADEFDTPRCRFMLGTEYASKKEEREAKHLDWYIRKMGPKFVKKMAMDKKHKKVLSEEAHAYESPTQRQPSVIRDLLLGRLSGVAVIDTSRVLDFDLLATGVEAFQETLPGLHHSTTGVYSDWDSKDISIGELVRARLPVPEQPKRNAFETRATGDGTKHWLTPLLVRDTKQRFDKRSRFLERSLGNLRLGRAQLQDWAYNEDQRNEQLEEDAPKQRAPNLMSNQRQGGSSRPSTVGMIDVSEDPGRGGFLAQEHKRELRGVRGESSYDDVEEVVGTTRSRGGRSTSGTQRSTWSGMSETLSEPRRKEPACSF